MKEGSCECVLSEWGRYVSVQALADRLYAGGDLLSTMIQSKIHPPTNTILIGSSTTARVRELQHYVKRYYFT